MWDENLLADVFVSRSRVVTYWPTTTASNRPLMHQSHKDQTMNEATCFSRDELRSYLLGELSDADLNGVAVHVETCIDCEATVAELDRESDTMIEALRQPVADDEPGSTYRLAAKRAVADLKKGGSTMQPLPRLRDYEIVEALARGGMGTVYRARHLRLNRQVALKVLPARWMQNPGVVARFEREMQAVGSLQHPAIVQATDGGEADGVHFLVMELIDGCDGSAMAKHLGPLAVSDACEIGRQVAIGMAYVHDQGIIHRDLKPSNLMVTRAGEVKVLDLGLARIVGEQLAEDELTTVGQLMGTLDYMAPEQLQDSHDVDERADIYSLGATLYKLLSGNSPHSRPAHEPLVAKLRRIASDQPPPLSDQRPDASEDLCELVDQMLSHDIESRPASMQEVADRLAVFCTTPNLARCVKATVKLQQREPVIDDPGAEFARDQRLSPENRGAKRDRSRFNRVTTWVAAGLFLLAAAMAAVITIQTTAGQLVIETASPDVQVRISKAGKPYKQLTLNQQANSLRLGAGKYEIELVSDADGLEIENGTYTLKRGETWLARIVHRSTALPLVSTADQPDAATYENKTFAQWIGLLQRERSATQLHEACLALDKLTDGHDERSALAAVLVAVRYHDHQASYSTPNGTGLVRSTVQSFLQNRDQHAVVESLTKELANKKAGSTDFILRYLHLNRDQMKSKIDAPLIQQIERLTSDESAMRRTQALGILKTVASTEIAVRHLTAALSDRDVSVRLLAAENLIEMDVNLPLVVSALRQMLPVGPLHYRAQAADLLASLGAKARLALPELKAVIQDENDAVTFQIAFSPSFGNGMGMMGGTASVERTYPGSVKDFAARALGEIGDDSVAPMLIAEWNRKISHGKKPSSVPRATPMYSGDEMAMDGGASRHDHLADAIEKLIDIRPHYEGELKRGRNHAATIWRANGKSLSEIYGAALAPEANSSLSLITDAQRLMPYANDFEKSAAMSSIRSVHSSKMPSLKALEVEVGLVELLAASDDTWKVLELMFRRSNGIYMRYGLLYVDQNVGARKLREQATVAAAYRESAVRIIRGTKDWKTLLVPRLIQWSSVSALPTAEVTMELLSDLTSEQQLRCVVNVLKFTTRRNVGTLDRVLEKADEWLDESANREQMNQFLNKASGNDWRELSRGLIQSGLSDEKTIEILVTRFVDDSIRRRETLSDLVDSIRARPELSQLVIRLLKHPVLDATQPMRPVSTRANMLKSLYNNGLSHQVPELRTYLEEVAETGKNGESEQAKLILDAWK